MLVVDAPLGGTQKTALDALKNPKVKGDEVFFAALNTKSQTKLKKINKIRVEKSNIMEMFE